MKKISHIIIALSFCCFWSCNKSALTSVELHGRVVNYITKAPVQATINLSNAATPSSKVNATTNTDGSFDLKSQGEWNSNNYYLEITEVNSSYIRMSYTINNRQNIDVGNILRGSYTFYCKVTLNPIDNSAIDFYGITAVQTHFNAGTATQFLCSATYSFDQYNLFAKNFPISYKIYPGGSVKDTVVYVSAPTVDTLSVTINY